jgi:DnaJ-class molecular chaperone
MARNYYVVLGVPQDARPDAIRSAFRQLALRYHPDRGAQSDARRFQDAAEAYGVLSDPGRRARYDRQIERSIRRVDRRRPAIRGRPLDFELILSDIEAERGVIVPFSLPATAACARCDGTGKEWPFPCFDCDGSGRILVEERFEVDVPRGVVDGTVLDISLEPLGVRDIWLRLRIRVVV